MMEASMRRRGMLALCVTAMLAVAGCGRVERTAEEAAGPPTETATSPGPGPQTQPAAPAPPEDSAGDPQAAGAEEATAYYTRGSGSRLWVEPETHPLGEPTLGVARAAIEQLLAGDTTDPALQTLAPAGTRVLGVDVDGRVLVVDLSGDVRQGSPGAAGETAFAQQLAHTAAQFDGIDAVRLHVDGQPVSQLWGHLDWAEPIAPDIMALAPVTIEAPSWGSAHAPGRVHVAGTANTFEATVELRLLRPDGSVAEEGFATATCGTGCRGDWEYTFQAEVTRPGRWVVEAIEPDPSDGEGFPPASDRVEIVVR
jgi:sporulation and spore germination protein/immunoglobulin-like protein involved in spore germination